MGPDVLPQRSVHAREGSRRVRHDRDLVAGESPLPELLAGRAERAPGIGAHQLGERRRLALIEPLEGPFQIDASERSGPNARAGTRGGRRARSSRRRPPSTHATPTTTPAMRARRPSRPGPPPGRRTPWSRPVAVRAVAPDRSAGSATRRTRTPRCPRGAAPEPRRPLRLDHAVERRKACEGGRRPRDQHDDEADTHRRCHDAGSPRCLVHLDRGGAAKPDASSSPTGVARMNPPLGPLRTTPGVAKACRARKPALVRSTIDTRKRRVVAAPAGDLAHDQAQPDVQQGDTEHEPEVRGMVLPVDIE